MAFSLDMILLSSCCRVDATRQAHMSMSLYHPSYKRKTLVSAQGVSIYMSRGSGQHQHLPPPPWGSPPPPVDVGVGWARVSPNNPNGTHGLRKGGLRIPTQWRPVLSTMGLHDMATG